MKKKYPSAQNDFEINLTDISSKLWKDKILIFLICLTFSIASYFYFSLQTKTYKTGVIFHEAPVKIFDEYIELSRVVSRPLENLAIDFNKDFREQLLLPDNFTEFVKKNNEISEFKSYLKDKNIDIRAYFKERFVIDYLEVESKKVIINKIYFIYEKNLPGEKVLSEYIIFVKNKTEEIFKRDISALGIYKLKDYKLNFMIASNTNINTPQLPFNIPIHSDALFLLGTKVITLKTIYLENLLDQNKTIRLNYNPISEKITPSANFISPKIYLALFFILGFFFSLIIIFIKSSMKNKSYL
jgi:LPS O-antigen subunit length determinant protein (WzzB/FepE family)